MSNDQYNRVVGIGIFLGAFIITVLCAALFGSTSGEVAASLGAVVGGVIGALGAALAVYLTLRGQREDETSRVFLALIMEVAQLSKFPAEQLGTCQLIHRRKFTFPKTKLSVLMETPAPVIYPAIANLISRLPNGLRAMPEFG